MAGKTHLTVTVTRELFNRIDKLSKRSFGGNRSVCAEFYLTKGLEAEQRLQDISVASTAET